MGVRTEQERGTRRTETRPGWTLHRTGEPVDVLTLSDLPDEEPGPGQLAIDVLAVGVTMPDVLQIRGAHQIALPLPCSPCSEVVGEVTSVGTGTTIPMGSRIFGLSAVPPGALRCQTVVNERDVSAVSKTCSPSLAAALPCNYVTAHLALHTRAKLREGETVVVAGAAGGVGSAAVQVARAAGARVVAADRGDRRLDFCRALGADAVVDAENPKDVTAAVAEFTDGGGADVVMDMVGGDLFDESRRFVSFEGRVVVVGFMSGRIAELRTNHLILRNFTVMGVNAMTYLEGHPAIHREARERVVELLEQGEIAPVIHAEYQLTQALAALGDLVGGEVLGKAVIRTS